MKRRKGDTSQRPELVVAHLMGRLSVAGGVQIVVRRLALGLVDEPVSLHVVTMRPAWDDVSDMPLTLHPGSFAGSRYRFRDRVAIIIHHAKAVRRIRPDVVHLHSGVAWLGFGALVIRQRGTKFVLEVHDPPGSDRHAASTDRIEGLLARVGRVRVICHSGQVADAVAARMRVPRAQIDCFPLGVDTDRFRPVGDIERTSWREEHGIGRESIVAITVARAAPLKRLDLVLDAVAALRVDGAPIELVMIGPAPDGDIRNQADALGIGTSVHLPGVVGDDDLASWIGSSDVLCSASEYEGFGLTIAEGMACGLPVVATAVGGVPDVVLDGLTGLLVSAGDHLEFANRLRELADSPDRRRILGEAGRKRAVERFGFASTAQSFLRVYRSVVAS